MSILQLNQGMPLQLLHTVRRQSRQKRCLRHIRRLLRKGTNPFIRTCCSVSLSLVMRTGADVRVSTPIIVASFVKNPRLYFPNSWKPLLKRSAMKRGIQKWRGEETNPGASKFPAGRNSVFSSEVCHSLCRCCLLHIALLPAEALQILLKIHHA